MSRQFSSILAISSDKQCKILCVTDPVSLMQLDNREQGLTLELSHQLVMFRKRKRKKKREKKGIVCCDCLFMEKQIACMFSVEECSTSLP